MNFVEKLNAEHNAKIEAEAAAVAAAAAAAEKALREAPKKTVRYVMYIVQKRVGVTTKTRPDASSQPCRVCKQHDKLEIVSSQVDANNKDLIWLRTRTTGWFSEKRINDASSSSSSSSGSSKGKRSTVPIVPKASPKIEGGVALISTRFEERESSSVKKNEAKLDIVFTFKLLYEEEGLFYMFVRTLRELNAFRSLLNNDSLLDATVRDRLSKIDRYFPDVQLDTDDATKEFLDDVELILDLSEGIERWLGGVFDISRMMEVKSEGKNNLVELSSFLEAKERDMMLLDYDLMGSFDSQ